MMKPQPTAAEIPSIEDLFRAHNAAVFMAAHRVTGNSMDAEDVLQTVFLRMVRRRAELARLDRPGAYLRHAAVNAALDIVRARRRSAEDPVGRSGVRELAADDPAPEAHAHGAELKDRMRSALGTVSPRSAEIFALRYFEGFGNIEIAEMLGTSPSAVGVVLHRTRNRLREELDAV